MQVPLLADDVEQLILERQLDRGTEGQYRRSVRFFSQWLGRPATRADLNERTVNEWLREIEPTCASTTTLGRKRGITAIWNWLAERQAVPHYNSRRLRRIKIVLSPPQAWSLENVRALLEGAQHVEGRLACGLPAVDLLRAWVMVAYETGLRPSDLRLLTRSSLQGRTLYLSQHKTNKPHFCTLSRQTVTLIEKIGRPDSEYLFGVPKSTMRRYELKLFKEAAKFGFVRRKRQGIGTLRKTHGTEIARTQGLEAAARSLGHVSGTKIARDHYVQPDALSTPLPPPPLNYVRSKRDRRTSSHHQSDARGTNTSRRRTG